LVSKAGQAHTPPHCDVGSFSIFKIPLIPAGIDEDDRIVGTTGNHKAAIWTMTHGLEELPLPEGFDLSEGVAISKGGIVAMAEDRAQSRRQAYVVNYGVVRLLGGVEQHARKISNDGSIVGDALMPGHQRSEPVEWKKDGMHTLGACCGGTAMGLNNQADIVGDVYDREGRYHAFLWSRAKGLQLIGPSDRYSISIAINDRGHLIVQAFTDVFLYLDQRAVPLQLSKSPKSQPIALNNCDTIVGSYGPYADANQAFVWSRKNGFQDLTSLVSNVSGWSLENATGITDSGTIIGTGTYQREETGFILVPR